MKVRKSAAPFYAVAVIWLAYALLFPLYRVSHFLIVGGISAAAFLVLTALCAKTGVPEGEKQEKQEEKPKEESTGNAELDAEFINGATARGLLNLTGHKVAGGMRASLYNAMPMEGVTALIDYMKEFETKHHV